MKKFNLLIVLAILLCSINSCFAEDLIEDLDFIGLGETTNGKVFMDTNNAIVTMDGDKVVRTQAIMCLILSEEGKREYSKIRQDFGKAEGMLIAFDANFREGTFKQLRLTVYAPYGDTIYTDTKVKAPFIPKEGTDVYFWMSKIKNTSQFLWEEEKSKS